MIIYSIIILNILFIIVIKNCITKYLIIFLVSKLVFVLCNSLNGLMNNSSILRVSSDCAFEPAKDCENIFQKKNIINVRKSSLYSLSINIVETFTQCNKDFRAIEKLPQRILTNPNEPSPENSDDNIESNLICRVHDRLESGRTSYKVLDLLGVGTFGQVFRCQKDDSKEVVAVKVIKNKPAYHNQGLLEIKILQLLNKKFDPNNKYHIVRLLESFEHKNHICQVFELLSMSLLDILTQNQFRGLPLNVVHRFTKQILEAMVVFQSANIIHCDL